MDEECDRGEVCEIETAECVDRVVDTTNTETPAPATFSSKAVPFFRGEVCTVHDVQAGQPIPIRLNPCFDPCITSNSFHHKHYYSCVGTHCQAWAIMYVDANATACPADAFGRFEESRCVYDKPVDLSITVTVADEPVSGNLYLEVPFLSNADMTEIAANFDNTDLIREKIDFYPQEAGRKVGADITMRPDGPMPPASCDAGGCECVKVGF